MTTNFERIKNMTIGEMAEFLRKKEENKMQDRFRFRVWKKYNCPSYDGHKPEMFYDAEKTYDFLFNKIPENCFSDILEDEEEYIVMQCTGLKDKNGKLVYIDDLIRLDDGLIGIVKQVEDVKSIDYGRIIVHLTCSLNKKYPTYYIPTVIAESEIIGNVYTNPELLESNN